MHLVIVESPSKAKTIEKYLGKGFKVMASKGHVVDLPKSELGIDVDHEYKPEYIITNEDSLSKLRDAFKEATELVLAVDPDREGEAIGWHIARELKLINDKGDIISRAKKLKRIVFTEITEEAIQEAIKNPRNIDMNLVNAQQARRVLDRLVGYKLSPLLWKKIRFGLSAGRVQSVAVRLVVDREEEREKFKADEYWSVISLLSTKRQNSKPIKTIRHYEQEQLIDPKNRLPFTLSKIDDNKIEITTEKQAETILKELLEFDEWPIEAIETRQIKRLPKPPFTTSTLEQAAANKFGMSAKETMRIAQKLYEAGHITYMRTDSTAIAASALSKLRSMISKTWGKEFLPEKPRFFKNKAKLSQEAHEAIRPSTFAKIPSSLKLDPKSARLYKLIWDRAVASQMSEAKLESTAVKVKVGKYTFQLNGQRIIFPGFLKVAKDEINETILPKLKEQQILYPFEHIADQHFTKPPARYSEATLIKALEAFGIGRPSTYAPIISTIISRKYVEKLGKYFKPTDTGIVVTKLLKAHFPEIVDTDFTAKMEEDLDLIASGEENWVKEIDEFYKPFIKNLEKKEKQIKKDDFTVLGSSRFKCPVCGKKTVIKLGRYGRFLSCEDFPKCKGMLSIEGKSEEEMMREAYSKDFLKIYKPAPKTEDGRDFLLKFGKYGKFWAHPDYPKVKDARPLEFTEKIFKQIYGATPKAEDGKKMVLRRGRFGEFWSHPDYPEVKEVKRLNMKQIKLTKKELGILN